MKRFASKRNEFLALTLTTSLAAGISLFQPCFAAVEYSEDAELAQKLNFPVYVWKDAAEPVQGIVIAIHGMTLHGRRFDSIARHLAEKNYVVVATDLRGFGNRQNLPTHKEGRTAVHYSLSQTDILSLIKELKTRYPEQKVFCFGESLGANMAIAMASEHPDVISGVVASSPCAKRIWHLTPRMFVDIGKSIFNPYQKVSMKPYVADRLSEDPRVIQHYLNDPLIRLNLTLAELLKSLGTNRRSLQAISKLPADMPVLIIAGEKDRIYSSKALKRLAAQSTSKLTELHVQKERGHLLLEHAYVPPDVISTIDGWMLQQTAVNVGGGLKVSKETVAPKIDPNL